MNARSKPTQAPEQTQLSDRTPSRGRLFASMMYEGVLLFAVTFLAGYLFDTLTQSRHGLVLRGTRQIWLFLAIGAYFFICWRRNGQTLPMKAWHIRLQSTAGGAHLGCSDPIRLAVISDVYRGNTLLGVLTYLVHTRWSVFARSPRRHPPN